MLALRSQPDGMPRPRGLLNALLATQFGVADTDNAGLARRKVVGGLSPWFDERGAREAATAQIDSVLPWAAKIEAASNRAKVEGRLLVLSARVSTHACRFDEARVALTAALARGELPGVARLRLNALSGLADISAALGHWHDSRAWAERMHAMASAKGPRSAGTKTRWRTSAPSANGAWNSNRWRH